MKSTINSVVFSFEDKSTYHWFVFNDVMVRGYAFYDGKLLEGKELCSLFTMVITEGDFYRVIDSLDGFFNIVKNGSSGLFVAVDRVRSLPMFYKHNDNTITLYDCLSRKQISENTCNSEVLDLFTEGIYTIHNETLLNTVFQLPRGSMLFFDGCKITCKQYIDSLYAGSQEKEGKSALELLKQGYLSSFTRTVQILGNRTAVVPLSGGHDSRLILFYLKHLGYQNIVAYSYGNKGNAESAISEKVAKELDVPWYFIEYKPREMHKVYKTYYEDFSLFAANCNGVPCLQEWFAVYKLKKEGVIDNNCVIIPGYAGDVLAGSKVMNWQNSEAGIVVDDLVELLIRKSFSEKKELCKDSKKKLKEKVVQYYFNGLDMKESISTTEANLIYESFFYDHKIVKYIENAVRVYEYWGLKWITPFFDSTQFDVWSRIDNSLRYNRRIFFEYEKQLYPKSIMSIPFFSRDSNNKESKWVRRIRILRGPSESHYALGYFHLGLRYYWYLYKRELFSFNGYAQKAYLDVFNKEVKHENPSKNN